MQLRAAVVGTAHGLKGEVYVTVTTDRPQALAPGTTVHTSHSEYSTLTMRSLRAHKDRVLAGFEEISTREQAEDLRGTELMVDALDEDDAWYPHQLTGLEAVTLLGEHLGTVTGMQPGAAQDLIIVDADGREVLVPFVSALVPEVNVDEGTITIDPIPGLFDDNYDMDGE